MGWFGLVGPANLPKDIVDKIEGVARTMMADPEARKTLTAAGLLPSLLTGIVGLFERIFVKKRRPHADDKGPVLGEVKS